MQEQGTGERRIYGELVPLGGGDPIPLRRTSLLLGRRESCDVVLRFTNVSSHHCQLSIQYGYWFIKDLNSTNGVKVNGVRVTEKRLDPGDRLIIAKHGYEIQYSPADLGAVGPPPVDDGIGDVFSRGLLERAGLTREDDTNAGVPAKMRTQERYDVLSDRAGQIKDPHKPL